MSTSEARPASVMAVGLLLSLAMALRGVAPWPVPSSDASTQHPLSAVLLLLAAASLVVVPLGLWLRRADLKTPASMDRALLLGAALSSLPLALFGSVLKSATHHRPLGGATFAVAACVSFGVCVAVARRVGTSTARLPWLKSFFSVCCVLSVAATLGFAVKTAHIFVDFLTLGLGCAGAGLLKTPRGLHRLPLGAVGVAWAALLAGGLLLTRDRALMLELTARAPISFAPLSWLGDGS